MAAHNTRPASGDVAASVPQEGWPIWLAAIARAVNLILRGKINATATVTLAASATTTTLTDSRIGYFSHVTLEAQTASASTARAAGIYVVAGGGSATIHHASNAAIDQTFSVLIIG